jgi:zinc protease
MPSTGNLQAPVELTSVTFQQTPPTVPLRFAFILVTALVLTARAELTIPPLKFDQRVLQNGMRVISCEDHSAPVVAIHVWYHVGSKDDPQGRSGFAHLFEHMLFKSTKRMPSEFLDRLTEDVGGQNNAYTESDRTVYHEVVPSHHLERLLWAEAERMSSLTVDVRNFTLEREVVKEEFRQSVLAQPYGEFGEFIQKQSFVEHPYKRPTIGNIEELDAAAIEDVRAFHQTFYRPDNATLIVAGDFDPASLQKWVDQYFAPIPKPDTPIPRVTTKEQERSGDRTIREYDEKVPFPALALTYLGPALRSEQRATWQILEAVLSQGDSSRLYRTLVYEKQLAQSAEFGADLREDLGLPTFQVILASGVPVAKARAAILDEIRRVVEKPITERELLTAKNQLLAMKLRERETANGKAEALGYAALMLGNVERVNTELAELQAVTVEQVQAAAAACFTPKNQLVIEYLPASMKPKTKESKGGKPANAVKSN